LNRWLQFCLALVAIWLIAGGRVPALPGVGEPPPFKVDQLSVLLVEQSSDRGRYTADQMNALQSTDARSIKATVEARGGAFHVLDMDSGSALVNAAPWVVSAFAVPRQGTPWIVAATPSSGFSAPLTTEADAMSRIGGLK
jgi:hypothetical protein